MLFKKAVKILVSLAASISILAMPVYATAESKDGLEAVLRADKDSYSSIDGIVVSLEVENTNDHAVKNVSLKNNAPEGYMLPDDSEGVLKVEKLEAGEMTVLKTLFVPESAGYENSAENTGDRSFVYAMIAAAGVILMLVCFAWKKKEGKRLLSVLLCVVTVGAVSPQTFSPYAEDLEAEPGFIALSKTVTAGGKEITFTSAVSYNSGFETNSLDKAPDPIHFVYTDYEGTKIDDHYLYYSDDYFSAPSTYYNPHLATLSIMMAKYSMNPGDPDDINDLEWYLRQSDRVCAFYHAIDFTSHNIWINDDYKARTTFDSIGIVVASKQVGDCTVIASTVRSGGYFNEWENNILLGTGENSDMMHEGWYNAANKVIDYIGKYIKGEHITGKVKLWISGYSRGGATMNLTAGLLDNKIRNDGSDNVFEGVTLERDDLYAYTFEAPQGANYNSTTVAPPKDALYNNMFNIVNPNDLVTKVAMGPFGFTRFGVDKYITTQFFDYDNFETNRNSVKALYAAEFPGNSWRCDELQMYTISGSRVFADLTSIINFAHEVINVMDSIDEGKMPSAIEKDTTKINYDANILGTLFFDKATEAIGSRKDFVDKYQSFLRKLVKYLMNDCPAPGAPSKMSLIGSIIWQGIVDSIFGDSDKVCDLTKLTDITPEEASNINGLLASVYLDYPNELISLGINAEAVFFNHDTDVSVAHVRAQDSYYVDAYNKEHPDATITIVPLRNDAGFCRVDLDDFNDCTLYSSQDSFKDAKVYIEGSSTSTSTIHNVAAGYAAGYYHYATCERIELFFPSGFDHLLNYAVYSNDISHDISATYYYYKSQKANTYRDKRMFHNAEGVHGDDGPYQEKFEAASKRLSDLTNTTWDIQFVLGSLNTKNIDFTSDGKSFTSITENYLENGARVTCTLYYGDEEVCKAGTPFYTPNWKRAGYSTITITGGADVTDPDLIDWLYSYAKLKK